MEYRMAYQSDVETLEDLIANFKSKSSVWQTDFIAVMNQVKTMVRPEYVETIQYVVDVMEEHGEQCELRGATVNAINAALADIVLYAIEHSCAEKPALIDRFEPGLVWALDEDACMSCGIKVHNGYLEDSGWYCDIDLVLKDVGLDPAPHGFDSFCIRMDRDTVEYLAYKYEVKYVKDILYEASISEWFVRSMSIQQLQDILAWVHAMRVAVYVRV